MGLSYFYVNRDKEQFFDCGLAGLNNRFNRVGTEPGSRALAILLPEHGTWQGDRIAVVGDTSEEFEGLVIRGIDIVVDAELMLMKFDGLGWVEECLDVSNRNWPMKPAKSIPRGFDAQPRLRHGRRLRSRQRDRLQGRC